MKALKSLIALVFLCSLVGSVLAQERYAALTLPKLAPQQTLIEKVCKKKKMETCVKRCLQRTMGSRCDVVCRQRYGC